MKNTKLGVWAAVISLNRPGNVQPMTEKIGEATWYVGPNPDHYLRAGAKRVVSCGALAPSRNRALEDAFAAKLPCLQLDDDLIRCHRISRHKKLQPLEFGELVALLLRTLETTGAKLAGIAPTSNPFYFSPERSVTHAGFVIASLMLALPSTPRSDPKLRLKEDYDYSLQHIDTYGQAARRNDLTALFKHYTNHGGAVDYRTTETEQEAIRVLKQKWPALVRDNPRRPNEILLKFGRPCSV